MQYKKLETRIANTFRERYGENLAAVLIFGSYFSGGYIPKVSDIDLIVLFKEKNKLKFHREHDLLFHKIFADINVKLPYFMTFKDYERHIYEEGAFSCWITAIKGSREIYSSKEFKEFKKKLERNPIPKKDIIEYIKHKDDIELDGYFTRLQGWNLTKSFYSHFRRKLQILNYYNKNSLEFNYDKCLFNLKDIEWEDELRKLDKIYHERKNLRKDQIKMYYKIAYDFTNLITKSLS